MRKWLILLSALAVHSASAAPAWTWVDAQGQVHYSDRPVPGARQIDLPGAQSFPGGVRTTNRAPRNSADPAGGAYQALNIVSPAPQETLWNIGANLNVLVELAPNLRPGHRIDVTLDGQRANLNSTRLQFALPNVFRGAHALQAHVIDEAGQVVQSSPPVQFVVQQTSTQNPNSIPGQSNNNRPSPQPPRPTPRTGN
jgi:hypothetical protein